MLQDCFEATDWNVFVDSWSIVTRLTDCITDYINMRLTKKTIKVYLSNKPWVPKSKGLLNKEEQAFRETKNSAERTQGPSRKGRKIINRR